MSANIYVSELQWSQQHEALSAIRREVFIVEQQVPEELEWDGLDSGCRHILAQDITKGIDNNNAVGTGRLVSDGQIGRMAILKEYRRQGIGYEILKLLISMAASEGHAKIYLHAQLYAVAFYQQAQFKIIGNEFLDAGIVHVKMTRTL